MPKKTFEKLKEEKKIRIFDSAVEEFSCKTFSEASINQIIKNAAIPRGSFYQYFEDKEDLYTYLITCIRKEKIEILLEFDKNHQLAFFNTFVRSMVYMLEWKKQKPKYFKIGMLMEKDDSDFVKSHKGMTSIGRNRLLDMIKNDQEKGRIRHDVDVEMVLDILITSGTRLVNKYSEGEQLDEVNFLVSMEKLLDLIKNGIGGTNE